MKRPPQVLADAETACLRENHPSHRERPFPRKAIVPWIAHPSEGRAPHARNDGTTPTQVLSSLGHRPLARPSGIMTCLALRPARTCGRGDRAPPKNQLPRILGASSLKARYPRLALASEGRALHARDERIGITRAHPR